MAEHPKQMLPSQYLTHVQYMFAHLRVACGKHVKQFLKIQIIQNDVHDTSVLNRLEYGHNTRSSPYVTLIKPPSSLKVTHRSFRHASPHLWNQLPTSLRIPHPNYSSPSQRPSLNMPV